MRFFEGMEREKKMKPNNRSDSLINNLNAHKHDNNSATDMKAFQQTSSAIDINSFFSESFARQKLLYC